MLGNKNGNKVFTIPVEWVVSENLERRPRPLSPML